MKIKQYLILAAVLVLSVLVSGAVSHALTGDASHMDGFKNPEGCAACHSGLGASGSSMLRGDINTVCFRCHGKRGAGRARTDVESVFEKRYIHPVFETQALHSSGEILPETEITAERHVSCIDCHVVHMTSEEKPLKGARGFLPGDPRGALARSFPRRQAKSDHELCYLCHSASRNLPSGATDKSLEFGSNTESFHPVETAGRNLNVPSLKEPLSETSTIACGSCHGNDSPWGPKGPHGSDIDGMLVAQYRTMDGPEGAYNYELCYTCHDRRSILRDDSFKRHNHHIAYNDISCYSCHDSHGSALNKHLIEFNKDVVSASDTSGGPLYMPGVSGSPKCYLKCHNIDHNESQVGGNPWPW